jgi:hypothetical protein
VRALEDALDRLRQGGATRPIASHEAERIFTLAFAIQELSRDFAEVARLFSGPGGENGQGPPHHHGEGRCSGDGRVLAEERQSRAARARTSSSARSS